ncbi:hypothetical protein MBLNU457_g0098t1 [Dothideomycetes sp. NU457]
MSTPTLTIPTITSFNLYSFHAQHFPHSTAPSRFFITSTEQIPSTTNQPIDTTQNDNLEYDEEYEEDLGTYPDGTARTLTNEQIAMFRHSEIQTLLRERRRAREAAESDGEYTPVPVSSTNGDESTSAAPSTRRDVEVAQTSSPGEGPPSVTPEIVLDNPQAKRKTHRGKKQKKKNRDRQWVQQNNAAQKRKWDEYIDDEDGSTHTHRRRARELDEQMDESVELAY